MNVVITGDVERPGQRENIAALYARIAPLVAEAFGTFPRCELGREPLPFWTWARRYYELRPFPVSADLVIGFELPFYIRYRPGRWVDVRRHVCRYPGEFYRIESSLDLEELERFNELLLYPVREDRDRWGGLLALQVHNDASLLLADGRFLGPWDFRDELEAWRATFETPDDPIEVLPHPLEPSSPWEPYLRGLLPRAVWTAPGIYPHLRRARSLCAISSSVLAEAKYFGVPEVRSLCGAIPPVGPALNLDRPEIWRTIAEACL